MNVLFHFPLPFFFIGEFSQLFGDKFLIASTQGVEVHACTAGCPQRHLLKHTPRVSAEPEEEIEPAEAKARQMGQVGDASLQAGDG